MITRLLGNDIAVCPYFAHVQELHKGGGQKMYGSILRKARLKAGLSQEELAERIYLSRSAVSRLENDKLKLTVDDAVRWGQATNAPEVVAAMLCNMDVSTIAAIADNITTFKALIGGLILWIF